MRTMETEQQKLRLLNFTDICSKSIRITSLYKKILFMISNTLILPLAVIFLFHSSFCNVAWDNYLTVAYLIPLLLLSLPSFSTIISVVSCAYLHGEITFQKVIAAVPKLMQPLLVTFLFCLLIFIVYSFVAFFVAWFFVFFFFGLLSFDLNSNGFSVLVIILFVLYLIGVAYIGAVWQLASVVSVVEHCDFEIEAIMKSVALIKGKTGISMAIFLLVNLCWVGTRYLFEKYLAVDQSMGVLWKVFLTSITLTLMCSFMLFGLVMQPVIYFVCKSYHGEDVDKSTLSNRLQVYIGPYVTLEAKDVIEERV